MGVEKFGVIGSGQMGNGIAQVAAASGLNVLMSDIQQDFCDKGMATIAKNLDRMVSKGKLDEGQKEAILARIETTTDLGDMAGVDFVVEAAVEREDLKFKIFEDLDKICPPHVILSTNTFYFQGGLFLRKCHLVIWSGSNLILKHIVLRDLNFQIHIEKKIGLL